MTARPDPADLARLYEGQDVFVIDRIVAPRRHADRAALLWILLVGMVALATLWRWDDLAAWLRPQLAAVQTSGPVPCREPSEFEQLHIVLAWQGGRLAVTGCLYVGSRGAYKSARIPAAHRP